MTKKYLNLLSQHFKHNIGRSKQFIYRNLVRVPNSCRKYNFVQFQQFSKEYMFTPGKCIHRLGDAMTPDIKVSDLVIEQFYSKYRVVSQEISSGFLGNIQQFIRIYRVVLQEISNSFIVNIEQFYRKYLVVSQEISSSFIEHIQQFHRKYRVVSQEISSIFIGNIQQFYRKYLVVLQEISRSFIVNIQ